MFGVGIDGNRFLFVRFRGNEWIDEEPVDVTPVTSNRFLRALFNLGTSGKPFLAQSLADDFGASSPPAKQLVMALYHSICSHQGVKAETLFAEWKSLFGTVCGYDAVHVPEKVKELATLYGIDGAIKEPGAVLFAAHTYFAIFMKFLAAEIIAFFHKLPSPLKRLTSAASRSKFCSELEDFERGSLFRHFNIANFLEGDLFSWYPSTLTDEVEAGLRELVRVFDTYNPGTLSEEPTKSQDLLKDLYLQIIPRQVRHDLGEYYTPDWVAELLLEKIGYDGNPNRRVLDPACGSGTFLVCAIAKMRAYFEAKREDMGFDEGELLGKILSNVVGFDLNPLAVLASRANFLIAVRDLLSYVDRIEIPIYLSDSVVTPAEYGDLFIGASTTARIPCAAMKPPFLKVPKEVGKDASMVARYADAIEHSIRVKLSAKDFVHECSERDISIHNPELHQALFQELVELESAGKNGIWARIIKNAFAPLFAGKFDFVFGNPPWINWESLPPEYRQMSAGIWEHYRLRGEIPVPRRQASDLSKTDVSILMTYVVADKYVNDGAKVGFVLPRTIFQSELGGWHFRQFVLPSRKHIRVVRVDDIDRLKPFRGQATNISCTAIFEIGKKTTYPVRWYLWRPNDGFVATAKTTWREIQSRTRCDSWGSLPIDSAQVQSPWMVGPSSSLEILRSIVRASPYGEIAREGVNTRGANGIFFVDARLERGRIFVRNRREDGRTERVPDVHQSIESEYLYPLLKGEDVSRFVATPSCCIVLPHSEANPPQPRPIRELPARTREYLTEFRSVLEARKKFRNFDPSERDWHGLYSVLAATFSDYKVVWREMSHGIIAAGVSESALPDGSLKLVIPDHKLFIIPCLSESEMHFVAGVLNSSVVNFIVASYAVTTGVSIHILSRIPLPRFNSRNEHDLAPEN